MTIFIIWPERRFVSDQQIESWFLDAVADAQIGPDRFHAESVREKAEALEDAGFITLGDWK